MTNKKNSPRILCPRWILFAIPIVGMWVLYQLHLHVKQKPPIASGKPPSQVYSVSEELHRYINAVKKHNWLINGSIEHTQNVVIPSPGHLPPSVVVVSKSPPIESGRSFYTVFSTDCTPFQDWQSIVLFHSAMAVGQRGFVVRIASGCSKEKSQQLHALYKKLFPDSGGDSNPDPLRVRLHVTPDFSKDEKTNRNYHFYNKPRGFQHWLQRTQGEMAAETIIALVDPDFVFLRPLDGRVRGANNSIFSSSYKPADMDFDFVTKGKPVAQMYGLGAPWTNDNHKHFKRGAICGEGSPCLLPTPRFGERHYAVGPPYILHMDDWKRLADSWTLFVPRVYEGYPHLLAEMYAYSMAAAHERLPHLQAEHMMVSCIDCYGEGWQWIDRLDNVCKPPVYSSSPDSQQERYAYYPGHEMPTFLHYCQSFKVNGMSFYKRHLRAELFNFSAGSPGCTHKLFEIPPPSVGGPIEIPKNAPKREINQLLAKRRDVFMYCTMHHSLNAAISFARGRLCS